MGSHAAAASSRPMISGVDSPSQPPIPCAAVFESALGWMGVVYTPAGVLRILLPRPHAQDIWHAIHAQFPLVEETLPTETPDGIAEQLRRYAEGEPVSFQVTLDWRGHTRFRQRVWRAAQQIPYGETRSYRWLAERLGRPGAARAVGQALSANPTPIVVPCHRVTASDGGLGGFAGGLDLKRRLLALERGENPLS